MKPIISAAIIASPSAGISQQYPGGPSWSAYDSNHGSGRTSFVSHSKGAPQGGVPVNSCKWGGKKQNVQKRPAKLGDLSKITGARTGTEQEIPAPCLAIITASGSHRIRTVFSGGEHAIGGERNTK